MTDRQQVWLAVYTAAIQGMFVRGDASHALVYANNLLAAATADKALEEFFNPSTQTQASAPPRVIPKRWD